MFYKLTLGSALLNRLSDESGPFSTSFPEEEDDDEDEDEIAVVMIDSGRLLGFWGT